MGETESEYQVTTVRMTADQWAAVRREAMRRATDKGTAKPDVSEVIRELVDAWRARKR